MELYTPWVHVIGTLETESNEQLRNIDSFKIFISECLKSCGVVELWYFYHQFNTWGFTGVIALQESHVSIHTRPECGLLTLDVFLCNYSSNNEEKAYFIFDAIQDYFKSCIREKTILKR